MNKNEFTMCLIAIIVVIYIHDNYYLSVKTKENFDAATTLMAPELVMGWSMIIGAFIVLLLCLSSDIYNYFIEWLTPAKTNVIQ